MIVYLTSRLGASVKRDGIRIPTPLCMENGLLESLQKHWKINAKVLIISADADDLERNDSILRCYAASLPMSGLSVRQIDMCDRRAERLADEMAGYDVVILAGGHVPTQNEFLQRIRLRERMESFDGILIGYSGGTMNCAKTVYAPPELEGESTDENYERFLSGLGITELMILPHYQALKNDILDGKRVLEDMIYPDSHGREFYALEDGSYIIIEGETTTLFGSAHLIKDGAIKQICRKDKSMII